MMAYVGSESSSYVAPSFQWYFCPVLTLFSDQGFTAAFRLLLL